MNTNLNYCNYCHQSFKSIPKFIKHTQHCSHRPASERKKIKLKIEDDEKANLISLVKEMNNRLNCLEFQYNEMKKYMIKEKKKINVLEWADKNINPRIEFSNFVKDWLATSLNPIIEANIQYILENNYITLYNLVFKEFAKINIIPIISFEQKVNKVFKFSNEKWSELQENDIVQLTNKILMASVKFILDIKKRLKEENKINDQFIMKFDRCIVKLYSVDIKTNRTFYAINSILYHTLKKDLKTIFSYDFEF